MAMVLMTTHGTIVCAGENGLVHVPFDQLNDGSNPLVFDLQAITRDGRHERMLTGQNTPVLLGHAPGLPAGCEALLGADRRTMVFRQDGKFYSCEPLNRSLARDRDQAGLWEQFLFVTEEDFAAIQHIYAHRWVQASAPLAVIERGAIGMREGFILALGDLAIDLRYNLPLLVHEPGGEPGPAHALALTVLVDGWKIDRIHLYRPMIYFTTFGTAYALDQAHTAIDSLLEFGKYDGHFHVITDHDAASFCARHPDLPPDRVSVQHLASSDWVGYVAAKYAILDHPAAFGFQPLLFLDTDIVCDAPIQPMLATILALDRVSAPLEEMTSLQTSPSAGASLIQRAGLDARLAGGLNGGTIGIPNLSRFAPELELIRTIITNHADINGRDHFRWVDQEVLNYVSFCTAHFDTSALLRFVRYGWKGNEFDPTRRLGLVHFWPPVKDRPKLDRMLDYVATLRGSAAS